MNISMELIRHFSATLLAACVVANAIGLSPSLRAARRASDVLVPSVGDRR